MPNLRIYPEWTGTPPTPAGDAITGFYAGDRFDLPWVIEGVPPETPIEQAWFTVKARATDADSQAPVQKIIGTEDVAGQGVIEQTGAPGSGNGLGRVRFRVFPTESRGIGTALREWDVQVRLQGDRRVYTAGKNTIQLLQDVTQSISYLDPDVAAIAFVPNAMALTDAEQKQATVIITDPDGGIITGKSVSYMSDNPSIASVHPSTGLVTGQSQGACVITASCEGRNAFLNVAVTNDVQSVVITPPVVGTITSPAAVQLTATPYNGLNGTGQALTGKTVQWLSSDRSIAVVNSSGQVTGLRSGTVTITAIIDGVQATRSVTVSLVPARLTIDSNSHSAPGGGGLSADQQWPTMLLQQRGMEGWDVQNFAVSGQETSAMLADAASQVWSTYNPSRSDEILVCWELTNDIDHSTDSASVIYNRVVTYCQGARAAGFKVVVMPCLVRNALRVDYETVRSVVNANLAAGWPGFADAYANVAALPELQDHTNRLYFQTDGIHLTEVAQALVSEVIYEAIQSIRRGGPVEVLPDVVTLIQSSLGGNSRVAGFYDSRDRISANGANINSHADARGAVGFGPSRHSPTQGTYPVGNAAAAGDRPTWQVSPASGPASTREIAYSGVRQGMFTRPSARYALSQGLTIIHVGTVENAGGTPKIVMCVEETSTDTFMALEVEFPDATRLGADFGGGARVFTTTNISTTRRVWLAYAPGNGGTAFTRVLNGAQVTQAVPAAANSNDCRLTSGRAFWDRPEDYAVQARELAQIVLAGAAPNVAELNAIAQWAATYRGPIGTV